MHKLQWVSEVKGASGLPVLLRTSTPTQPQRVLPNIMNFAKPRVAGPASYVTTKRDSSSRDSWVGMQKLWYN